MEHLKGRHLKAFILRLLKEESLAGALEALSLMPPRRVVNPLFSLILSTEPGIKWRAVTAMGETVARLAGRDMESARVIMRRFMWQLNDESGGIGWGCPESMGEIMAIHEGLAREFSPVLISYINEQGNYLEYEPLRAGAVWGIGRLAQSRPQRAREAGDHLGPLVGSADPLVRGLAVWTLGSLRAKKATSLMKTLLEDRAVFELYRNRELKIYSVKDLAQEALHRMQG